VLDNGIESLQSLQDARSFRFKAVRPFWIVIHNDDRITYSPAASASTPSINSDL
jgi:hypothetical protein